MASPCSTGGQIVNDPNDVYQPITAAFGGQWVAAMLDKYGPANDGGVQMWDLDNEPEWWDGTHSDIYHQAGAPVEPATYDDMLARDLAAAQAVKAADPTALVVGPVAGGWPGYLFSKKDFESGWGTGPHFQYWANPVDRNAHGGMPWLAYFLQQMQAASNQAGTRLLDYLDVHGYVYPCVTNDWQHERDWFRYGRRSCDDRPPHAIDAGVLGSELHRPRGDAPNRFRPVRRLQRHVRRRRAAASADA